MKLLTMVKLLLLICIISIKTILPAESKTVQSNIQNSSNSNKIYFASDLIKGGVINIKNERLLVWSLKGQVQIGSLSDKFRNIQIPSMYIEAVITNDDMGEFKILIVGRKRNSGGGVEVGMALMLNEFGEIINKWELFNKSYISVACHNNECFVSDLGSILQLLPNNTVKEYLEFRTLAYILVNQKGEKVICIEGNYSKHDYFLPSIQLYSTANELKWSKQSQWNEIIPIICDNWLVESNENKIYVRELISGNIVKEKVIPNIISFVYGTNNILYAAQENCILTLRLPELEILNKREISNDKIVTINTFESDIICLFKSGTLERFKSVNN